MQFIDLSIKNTTFDILSMTFKKYFFRKRECLQSTGSIWLTLSRISRICYDKGANFTAPLCMKNWNQNMFIVTCLFSWMCSVLFIFQSSFNAAVNTKWTDFYLLRFEFTIVLMKKLHPITLLQINRTDFHDWDSWEIIIRFWKKEKKNSLKFQPGFRTPDLDFFFLLTKLH